MKRYYTGILIAAALVLNGCAVPKQGDNQQSNNQSDQTNAAQVCNPVAVGITAAVVCGITARGNNRVRAGAVCAAIAVTGCYLANSYKAEQMRTAKQVEDEFLKKNRTLPAKPAIASYGYQVNPSGAVSKGQEVKVSSMIVAVPGRNDRNVVVEEELRIVDAQGEVWGKPFRKTANPSGQAGEFQTSFAITIGDAWSQGVYTIERTLYLNGVATGRADSRARFQVV